MAAYVGLYLCVGPWIGAERTPGHHRIELAIVIVLAVLAARGSATARMTLIIANVAGAFVLVAGNSQAAATSAVVLTRLGDLACVMLQIALLVSSPMFQRTRPGWSPGRFEPAPWWPAPPLWVLLASAGAGLIITALPFSGNSTLASCPAGGHPPVAPHTLCLANGAGYPIPFRFTGGVMTMHNGTFGWLNVVAPRGVQAGGFTADWVLWGLGILLVLYLSWLCSVRPAPEADVPPAAVLA